MQKEAFRTWYLSHGHTPNGAATYINYLNRAETLFAVNLDDEYLSDRCDRILSILSYSAYEYSNGRIPLTDIGLGRYANPAKVANDTAEGVKKYVQFLDRFSFVSKRSFVGSSSSPSILFLGKEADSFPVFYDTDVTDRERIPGLVDFVRMQLDRIGSSKIFGMVLRHFSSALSLFTIPIILSKELPIEEHYWVNPDDPDHPILLDRDRINGMYFHAGAPIFSRNQFHFDDDYPYIKIFYRNMGTDDPEEFQASVAQTLSHEVFHFLHDVISHPTFSKDAPHRKDVLEGCADFFSVKYILGLSLPSFTKHADDRIDIWRKRFLYWPYSKALHFYPDDYEKFLGTIRTSQTDMEKAFTFMIT